MKRKLKIFKHFYAFVLLLFILQVESQATAEHTREVESENSNAHVTHANTSVQGTHIFKTQKLKSQDTEPTQLETRDRGVVDTGEEVAEVDTNDLAEPETESTKLGGDGGKKVNAAEKNPTSGRNIYEGSGTSNPSGDVIPSEELENKKKQINSPTGPLALRSLKSYDIPDIPENVARELCQSMRHSKIPSSHSFLWAALKNPSTRLKHSFSLVAPRFFPGCYKWRWSLCGGKPQPPLLENCGFFSTVRIENDRCGYVVRNTNTGRLDGPLKETAKNCPCDWPCLPFFDPIQNCRWNLGDPAKSSNDRTETDGAGFSTFAFYLNHGRAEQLCRAVEKTKPDMSFLVKSIPIQVQLDSHTSQADECVQWKWEPCSGSSGGTDDGNTDLRRRRSIPADGDDIGVVKIGWLDENINNGSPASGSDGNGPVGPSQINGGDSSTPSSPTKGPSLSSGSTCGVESCFPYSATDQEVTSNVQAGRQCDVWKKIIKPDDKCEVYRQASLNLPGEDTTEAMAALLVTEVEKDNQPITSQPPSYDRDKEISEPPENKAAPSSGQADGDGDEIIHVEDDEAEVLDLDANDRVSRSTGHVPVKSSLSVEAQPPSAYQRLTHLENSRSKRKAQFVKKRLRDSLCDNPSDKDLPMCKYLEKSLGYDLLMGRAVVNRPAPTHALIQCNWFAELVHCTAIGTPRKHPSPPTGQKKKRMVQVEGQIFVNSPISSTKRMKREKRSSLRHLLRRHPRDVWRVGHGASRRNADPLHSGEKENSSQIGRPDRNEGTSGRGWIPSKGESGNGNDAGSDEEPGVTDANNRLFDEHMQIKEPRQCGMFGCYPVNPKTIDPDSLQSLMKEEPTLNPYGGYVLCEYTNGKPACNFVPLTTHKHDTVSNVKVRK